MTIRLYTRYLPTGLSFAFTQTRSVETQDPDVVHMSFVPEPGAKTEEHDVRTNGGRIHVDDSRTGKENA